MSTVTEVLLSLNRRTVVQYDFRDDETWAYCNDGTVYKLIGGYGAGVEVYVPVGTATIPTAGVSRMRNDDTDTELLDEIREREALLGEDFVHALNRYANAEFDCGEADGESPEYTAKWRAAKEARLEVILRIKSVRSLQVPA